MQQIYIEQFDGTFSTFVRYPVNTLDEVLEAELFVTIFITTLVILVGVYGYAHIRTILKGKAYAGKKNTNVS